LEELGAKFVSMGYDGSSIFEGDQVSVTLWFKEKIVHFLIKVHYFVHKTNLVVVTLLELDIMCQLEGILQTLYVFFVHCLKKILEFHKLS
jgi:hypothetical protein